jgi:hypothetical protein
VAARDGASIYAPRRDAISVVDLFRQDPRIGAAARCRSFGAEQFAQFEDAGLALVGGF